MAKNEFKVKEVEPLIEEIREEEEVPEPIAKKQRSRAGRTFLDVVNGNFLTKDFTLQQLPFVFFLTLIAILYISNTYYAEKTVRKINAVTNELKELRSEYITIKSDLMFISKQSEVANAASKYGIKESVVPPKKIVIGN
jgi:hypothetical protein